MRKLTSAAPERNISNTPPQPKKGTCFHKGEKNGIIFFVFFLCKSKIKKEIFHGVLQFLEPGFIEK